MAPITRKKATVSAVQSAYKANSKSDDKLLSLVKKLNLKIDKNHADIGVKIDQLAINHRGELIQNLHDIESKMDDKLQKCLSTNTSKIEHLTNVIEDNERVAKLNDVVLKGIPLKKNENLVTIFDHISSAIGFEVNHSTVNIIIRLQHRNNQTAPPILVKFLSIIQKRQFMTQYYAHRDLNLSEIGMDSEGRIYATDNLTKLNYNIQLKAIKMLKDQAISKIHTRSGLVYVKFTGADDFVKILHLDDLNLMCHDANETAASTKR